jgi:hypothetical protein
MSEENWETEPLPLKREERPFELWNRAKGDFSNAVALIPQAWSIEKHQRWYQRLMLIRDNEHVRRIEQSMYKRRWDEQWKVANRWQSGQPAYDRELIDVFNWWLSEKAEWWLAQRHGLVSLDTWVTDLWKDTRVQVAWPFIAEAIYRLELWKNELKKTLRGSPVLDPSRASFMKFFRTLVKEQTVPEGIPFGIRFDTLRTRVSAQVKRIRGKLNVPRERFNVTEAGLYRVASPFVPNTPLEDGSNRSNVPFE